MKIHNVAQKSPEWFRLRAFNFTASEFGAFCLEPRSVNLTVKEIIAELDKLSIPCKRSAKRDELLELLPDPEDYATVSGGAMTAILKKIQESKIQAIRDRHPSERTEWDNQVLAWQDEIDEGIERKFAYNVAVRRGNALEPEARYFYEQTTGHKVEQIGFVTHDDGCFGCSPDGMIGEAPFTSGMSHGLEIKCPFPETHMAYLLAGTLPDEYKFQVHGSMAVTGLDRWDFLSYCPGEAPLLLTVERDSFTNQLEAGLKQLVEEKRNVESRLASIWEAAMEKEVQP